MLDALISLPDSKLINAHYKQIHPKTGVADLVPPRTLFGRTYITAAFMFVYMHDVVAMCTIPTELSALSQYSS